MHRVVISSYPSVCEFITCCLDVYASDFGAREGEGPEVGREAGRERLEEREGEDTLAPSVLCSNSG